jgi:hypothetical protein
MVEKENQQSKERSLAKSMERNRHLIEEVETYSRHLEIQTVIKHPG